MKSTLMMIATAAGTCAFASAPEVTVNSTVQDRSRAVKVTYTIAGEPAVVTPYAETNRGDGVWIDIGSGNVSFCTGDINKLVDVGDHEFTWQADKSWPNHRIAEGKIRVGVKAWATNAPPDYMVVDLDQQHVIRYYASVGQLPGGLADKQYRTRKLVMRKIPAAGVTWRMGQPAAEREGLSGCMTQMGEVTLSADYYMAIYKLTAYQYWLITGETELGGRAIGSLTEWNEPADETPARRISWLCARSDLHSNSDDVKYQWPGSGHTVASYSVLGMLRGKSGVDFDLPTDAQWEYAFRAGEADACYLGGLVTQQKMNEIGWQKSNYTKVIDDVNVTATSHPVGQLKPNNWGLYDMCGNGREWCLDYYGEDPATMFGSDPVGAASNASKNRVTRTGGYGKDWHEVALARLGYARNIQDDTFCVRVACPAIVPSTAK